jgi:hypothetical protein
MIASRRDYIRAVEALTPALKRRRRRSSHRSPAHRKDLRTALAWNASGNVLGFGVGPKRVDGEPDYGTTCLIVFVARKLARRKVPSAERIPARARVHTLERTLPTDLIEVGSIPQLQASSTLQPGTNAAHFTMRTGSLTAVVQTRRVPKQLLLLSCCHGFAPTGSSGRQIESPPDLLAATITNWVADLSDFEPLRPGGVAANRIDAAVAIPHHDMVPKTSNNVPGFGRLVSASALHSGQFAENGVRRFDGAGAATARVRGDLLAEHVSTLLGDVLGRVFLFQGLVAYDPTPLTQAGDSGMPLFIRVPGGLQLIGLHIGLGRIAGTRRGAAFFVPIVDVLDRFGIDLLV